MFYHVKDLQFNARVSKPDPRFARILLEAFGGANGELTSAMQYFVQAFSCHNPFPDKYDYGYRYGRIDASRNSRSYHTNASRSGKR